MEERADEGKPDAKQRRTPYQESERERGTTAATTARCSVCVGGGGARGPAAATTNYTVGAHNTAVLGVDLYEKAAAVHAIF
jgi:hypothetical protein